MDTEKSANVPKVNQTLIGPVETRDMLLARIKKLEMEKIQFLEEIQNLKHEARNMKNKLAASKAKLKSVINREVSDTQKRKIITDTLKPFLTKVSHLNPILRLNYPEILRSFLI